MVGWIYLAQSGPNRFASLGRHQGINCPEHAGEPRLDPGERGCQNSGIPLDAEAHHMDGGLLANKGTDRAE